MGNNKFIKKIKNKFDGSRLIIKLFFIFIMSISFLFVQNKLEKNVVYADSGFDYSYDSGSSSSSSWDSDWSSSSSSSSDYDGDSDIGGAFITIIIMIIIIVYYVVKGSINKESSTNYQYVAILMTVVLLIK